MDDSRPGYYAVIPADVRYDDSIPANAKLLYGEISSLIGAEGYCYASNQYFANIYGMTPENIARLLTKLENAGHIQRVIEKDNSGQIVSRKLFLKVSVPDGLGIDKKINTPLQKNQEGIDKKINKTNTSNTNIEKENKKRKKTVEPLPLFVDWIRTGFPEAAPDAKNLLYSHLVQYSQMRADSKSPLNTKRKVDGLLADLADESRGDLPMMCEILKIATRRCWLSVHAPNSQMQQPAPKEERQYKCL